jgi:hypothetical protein
MRWTLRGIDNDVVEAVSRVRLATNARLGAIVSGAIREGIGAVERRLRNDARWDEPSIAELAEDRARAIECLALALALAGADGQL